MVVAGQNPTLPKPANGWRLAPPNENGFVFYEIGTAAVCSERTDLPAVNTVGSSWFENPVIRNVPFGDTTPVGVVIVDPSDGSRWQKMSNPTPFGTAYWFQRVG